MVPQEEEGTRVAATARPLRGRGEAQNWAGHTAWPRGAGNPWRLRKGEGPWTGREEAGGLCERRSGSRKGGESVLKTWEPWHLASQVKGCFLAYYYFGMRV